MSEVLTALTNVLRAMGYFITTSKVFSAGYVTLIVLVIICILTTKHLMSYGMYYYKSKDTQELRKSYNGTLSKLIRTMRSKFFNYKFAPIILIVGTNHIVDIGVNNIRYSGSNMGWGVNEHLAVLTIPDDGCILPIGMFMDMTDGSGFQALMFNIPYSAIENYKSPCIKILQEYECIVNKTGIMPNVFITVQIDNFAVLNTEIPLGTNLEDNDQFIISCIQELLDNSNLSIETVAQLKKFQAFSMYCSEILSGKIRLKGIYICSSDQSKNLVLLDNLINVVVYNSCNDVDRKFEYSSRVTQFFNALQSILFAASMIALPLLVVKNKLNYENTPVTIQSMKSIIDGNTFSSEEFSALIDDVRIPPFSNVILKMLGQSDLDGKTLKLLKEYIAKNLHLVVPSKEIFEPFDGLPSDTIVYRLTFERIDDLEKIENDLFDPIAYEQYMETVMQVLFKNYYNYELLRAENELNTLLSMNYNLTSSIPELVNKIKICCDKIIRYSKQHKHFWNSKEYIVEFNTSILKHMHNELGLKFIRNHDRVLSRIGEESENFSVPVVGNIFINKTELTQDFIDFSNTINKLNSHRTFYHVSNGKMGNNVFLVWNLRDLQDGLDSLGSLSECVGFVTNSGQKPFFINILRLHSTKFCSELLTSCGSSEVYNMPIHEKSQNMIGLLNILDQMAAKGDVSFIIPYMASNLQILYDCILNELDDILACGNTNEMNDRLDMLMKDVTPLMTAYYRYNTNIAESLKFILKDINNKIVKDGLDKVHNVPVKHLRIDDYKAKDESILSRKLNEKIVGIVSEKNKKYISDLSGEFNAMCKVFNDDILPYFPFSSQSDIIVRSGKLIEFCQMYDKVKSKIDPEFFENDTHPLSVLDKVRTMFVIEGDSLFLKLNIDCNSMNKGMLSDIKSYSLLLNSLNAVQEKDGVISCKLNCDENMILRVELGENKSQRPVDSKIQTNGISITTKNAHSRHYVSYGTHRTFGIFELINMFRVNDDGINDDQVVIQLEFSTEHLSKKHKIHTKLLFNNMYLPDRCSKIPPIPV